MIRAFLVALSFLTRLPAPRGLSPKPEEIPRSATFFPLVGAIVGAGADLVYGALKSSFPASTCVIFTLIYLALITNALHEDGLADTLDGLGGGWSREQSLSIMRDSRIGSFGALGLIFLVLAKYNLLSFLEWRQLWRWMIFTQSASRWTSLPLSMWLDNARKDGQGSLIAQRLSRGTVMFGTLTLLIVACLLPLRSALIGIAVSTAVPVLSGLYYRRRLQGITGDCLGATNQITEVSLYLAALALKTLA